MVVAVRSYLLIACLKSSKKNEYDCVVENHNWTDCKGGAYEG